MNLINHEELWINTKYFIDAFRCVCSLSYLEENFDICYFIDSKDFIDGKLHKFVINLCSLVDIHCKYSISNSKRPSYKKMLKTMCPSFDWMFYERDKNAAHKDLDYKITSNINILELIKKMKQAIKTTEIVCSNVISDKIKYEYYSYDSLLFRYVNGITPNLEKLFNDFYIKPSVKEKDSTLFFNVYDARQVRYLDSDKNYCVCLSNGLLFQPYDMLQHREDFCIIENALWHHDSWVFLNKENADKMLELFFKVFNDFKNSK